MAIRDDIAELLDLVDLESYLSQEGVDFKVARGRSGIQLNVKTCPICGNNKWKVYLNAETGAGNCFGGDHPPGKNYSKWSFIKALHGDTGHADILNRLRAYGKESGWKPKRKSIAVEENSEAVTLPESVAIEPGRQLKYLENRGIPVEIAQYFHLRYCHSGFYRYRLRGEWKFMDFGARIIIPVYDLDGRLVTFQGRDITGTAERKYLFPPGLEASGCHLLNGMNVHNTKRVVIGEGAFDVMALKIALDQDVSTRDVTPVGTFGKHLSWGGENTQQMKFLDLRNRGVEEVTFMWDGEIPATEAAISSAQKLADLGYRVRIGMLPPDKDPNEVTPEVVRKTFFEAVPFSRLNAATILLRRNEMNRRASKDAVT